MATLLVTFTCLLPSFAFGDVESSAAAAAPENEIRLTPLGSNPKDDSLQPAVTETSHIPPKERRMQQSSNVLKSAPYPKTLLISTSSQTLRSVYRNQIVN